MKYLRQTQKLPEHWVKVKPLHITQMEVWVLMRPLDGTGRLGAEEIETKLNNLTRPI